MDDSDGDGVYTITLSLAQERRSTSSWAMELRAVRALTVQNLNNCSGEYVNRVVLVEGPTVVRLCVSTAARRVPDAVLGACDG